MFASTAFFPRRLHVAILAALTVLAVCCRAELTLGPLFCDGAVLQCDKPLAIWGTAAPRELVQVSFAGQARRAATGADGRWIAMLDALPATGVGEDLVVRGTKETLVVHDVVVGEVWLGAGESNLEFPVRNAVDAEREIATANYPLLRCLGVDHQVSATAVRCVGTSGWKAATPANVGDFTAVGYFFAREIHQRLGVPVGLIQSSWSDTPIEAWMSPRVLHGDPAFQSVSARWDEAVAGYEAAKARYDEKVTAWASGEAAAKARGQQAFALWTRQNPRPLPPHGGADDPWRPSGLYNGMINPLVPYALRGVLWYQGESNAGRPLEYRTLFPAMIAGWRAHFAQGDLPFFWVNLAAWRANDPTDASWAWLRDAQTRALAVPNTGQAVAIDVGDPINIRPREKREVGRRLALLAKHRVYGLMAEDTGPGFASASAEGAAIRVQFTNVGGGLVAHNRPPQALEIAGADHVFHAAAGRIERDALVVTSPQVRRPLAVRYAWHNCPDANLYGGNGLPVVPFRSDDWPEDGPAR